MDTQKAKQTLLDIKAVLNKLQVKFWLVDGVALGAVRDKAFIPYDKDMDLRVMAKDCTLSGLSKAFKEAGFAVRTSINPKLYGDLPSGIIVTKRGIKTDMCFGYYYLPEDLVVVLAGAPRSNYDILPAGLFRGNHFVNFCGTRCRIPYPADDYLTLHYGSDWKTPKQTSYSPPNSKRISLAKYADYFHKHPGGEI